MSSFSCSSNSFKNNIHNRKLDSYWCRNRRIRVIILKGKIGIFKAKNIFFLSINFHFWKISWCTSKLLFHLFNMIIIDMHITKSMNKFSGFQISYLCHHHRKECIRSNIEGNTEEYISRALIQLTRKLPIRNIELKKRMAWWRRTIRILYKSFYLSHIPPRNDISSRIRIIHDCIKGVCYLINRDTVSSIPFAPLLSIDRSEVSPFLRKMDISFNFFNKIFHLRIPFRRISGKLLSQIIFLDIH